MKLLTALALVPTLGFAAPMVDQGPGPVSPFVVPASWNVTKEEVFNVTERLLFGVDINTFLDARKRQDPSWLDWSSDGCTAAPDKPAGNDFLACCQRHDFGYYNLQHQCRFNRYYKSAVDNNFRNDMFNVCNTKGKAARFFCRGWAKLYYAAVDIFPYGEPTWVCTNKPVTAIQAESAHQNETINETSVNYNLEHQRRSSPDDKIAVDEKSLWDVAALCKGSIWGVQFGCAFHCWIDYVIHPYNPKPLCKLLAKAKSSHLDDPIDEAQQLQQGGLLPSATAEDK